MYKLDLKYTFMYLLLCISTFFCLFIYASPTQPSDVKYYKHENSKFSIIFHKDFLNENKKYFKYINRKLIYYDGIFQNTFNKPLKEKPIYIFSSSRNQISNATTSSIPFLRIVFFPTGVGQITNLATIYWEDTVITHEMAHVFQLGQISDQLTFLNLIFKNSEVVFLPIPIFLNVNLTMPTFLLEGHSVLNESIFAPGGRLYSGSTRALVFSQIKNMFQTTEQFTKKYIINITNDTFTQTQQYAHGGYFFNTLLYKYDLQTVNSFFKNYAEHFMFPLSFSAMKSTFKKTFDTSFQNLIHYYIQHYRPLALQQKISPEKPLFYSSICPPFNKIQNKIVFLTSDSKSTPHLKTLDITTDKWTDITTNFIPGKIFKLNKQYVVSASYFINSKETVYALFSEGMYFKKYKSQSVQDIYENNVLSIDTSNNFHGFKLLFNNRFYDYTNSTALFDKTGNIYYFKQKGNQRILYRNKIPIFNFKGFYGKIVEIDTNNTIYFIAATKFGSSLFAWNINLGIYRVSSSDVIIDAIKTSNTSFLVCEITPHSYAYKLIPIDIESEKPIFYNYDFKKISNSVSNKQSNTKKVNPLLISNITTEDSLSISEIIQKPDNSSYSSYNNQTIDPLLIPDTTQIPDNPSYSSYNQFQNIRFNGINLKLNYNSKIEGYQGIVNISFQDPLEYSAFDFSYLQSLNTSALQTQYTNTTYLISWNTNYIYKQGFENFLGARTYSYIHELSYGMSFPIIKKGYWLSYLKFKTALTSIQIQKKDKPSYYSSIEPTLQILYGKIYNKNFDFYRQFILIASLPVHFKLFNKSINIQKSIYAHYIINWGWEFYTTPFFTYKSALKQKSIPFLFFKGLNIKTPVNLNIFLDKRVFSETNNYSSGGIKFQKFIDTPFYFSRFPISISGVAPLLSGQYIKYLNNKNNKWQHIVEWTYGLKTKILLHHKVYVNINLYSGYSIPLNTVATTTQKENLHFGVQIHSNF